MYSITILGEGKCVLFREVSLIQGCHLRGVLHNVLHYGKDVLYTLTYNYVSALDKNLIVHTMHTAYNKYYYARPPKKGQMYVRVYT